MVVPVISPSEWRRKAVHAGMGLLALTLRWLDWKAAAAVALAALLFGQAEDLLQLLLRNVHLVADVAGDALVEYLARRGRLEA